MGNFETVITKIQRQPRQGNFNCGALKDNRDAKLLQRQRAVCLVVARAVAERFNYTLPQLLSPAKHKDIARVRLMAMAIASDLSGASEPEVARAFNRKDHNSTRHAKKVAAETFSRPEWAPCFKETKAVALAAVKEAKL
jgi:chromosomal replication initiation ATPase DnaA